MRRGVELVLMVGGAFAFAFGLDLLRSTASSWQSVAMAGLGWAALALGVVLSLRTDKKPRDAGRGGLLPIAETMAAPLGTTTLAFQAGGPPRVVARDPDLAVSIDGDGTVRFKLQRSRADGRLVCRTSGASPVFFNTLRGDRSEAAIKLIGPMPPLLRLEIWDRAAEESRAGSGASHSPAAARN